ncbi:MAG: hypothetical protein DHS20C18_46190 [Saprospiraceae bacterium]|nr:MAG: hypothetical protein DHS20C18_46190 [Saprospiraceae bacterium]
MIKKICFLLFISSLFLCYHIHAQDTIVVQTLTLNSTERAGDYDFPDDPDQSYEKILMTYKMRCHGGQVGSGNVGCREWDYSCNTFITDSSRVDSNQAVHASHLISNFNDEVFEYTFEPTYTYYQYQQRQITFTDTISENIASIGNGTDNISLAGNQPTTKAQFLYTVDELTTAGLTAGSITSMNLQLAQAGDVLSFLRINMKATSKTVLDETDPDLDGFTEVYFLNTDFTGAGDHAFNFYNAFDWDGSSNIIVELSFTNSGMSTVSDLSSHDAGFDATLISGDTDYSLQFLGSGRIPLDASALSTVNDQITIALWVNGAADIMPVNSTIFEGTDASNQRQVNVHLPWGNGQVYWDCGNDGSNYDRINLAADPASWEGQWNHWAFTKNTNTGEMKIYLNGELFHSGSGLTRPIDINAFTFAGNIAGSNSYFGKIDELQIWDVELDQPTIQSWMRQSIDNSHPNYNNLRAYFALNEGSGNALTDASSSMVNTAVNGVPSWKQTRGKDLYKGFMTHTFRPNIDFVQGEYTVNETVVVVLDSVLNDVHQVLEYAVDGSDLIIVDTFFAYQAGMTYVYDESGVVVDTVFNASQNTINIGELSYYNKFPAKYEILSLVTPYGNGLDLGSGKTFTFDVTDYAPILKGSKHMSIELGGQNQEELDIQFLFITGTPPRTVKNIQNIWPFRRGNYGSIQTDEVFEPRVLQLDADGHYFKIRSSITGHGQNGEFVQRTHYLNLGGGANEFEFPVWKACGSIPIYPQGGTWLFDRAGWCPGDPTDVQYSDITSLVTPGESIEVDYGVIGAHLTEANYLVSQQLVTYGAANFGNDAAVIDVIRPSKKVEHERFNPACNRPAIVIQNTGSNTLTSLDISYKVQGGNALTYTWTGSLELMETAEVELPVGDISFWETMEAPGVFEVTISSPNGIADEYANNNVIRSAFNSFAIFEGSITLKYKTNSRPNENRMFITDHAGDVVLEKTDMEANTTYEDDISLPSGCYTMHFTDTGGDGLYYWYWEAIGQNLGTGYVRFQRRVTDIITLPIKNFESEFGSFIQFDFFLPEPVAVDDLVEDASLISLFPNPTTGEFTLELMGYENKDITIELFDAAGRKIETKFLEDNALTQLQTNFDLEAYANGLYLIRIFDGNRVNYRKLVKSND